MLKALIFDVDGTLAETEEIHRSCFNAAFKSAGLDWHWDKLQYAALLTTTGGKERIVRFVSDQKLPQLPAAAVANLHRAKNQFYSDALAQNGIPLRPGVAQIIKAAQHEGLKLGIATTTSRSNLVALLRCGFGPESENVFDVIVCGEDVQRKKPDPEVYVLCLGRLGVEPSAALAFEDSSVGLKAALAAGIKTIVTPSSYTMADDFTGANHVIGDLVGLGIHEIEMS
jgi:HAD superfamily hydrolase (TIGR01509 family)